MKKLKFNKFSKKSNNPLFLIEKEHIFNS